MELTEEEQDLYTKSKTEYEAKISEHTKQKEGIEKISHQKLLDGKGTKVIRKVNLN